MPRYINWNLRDMEVDFGIIPIPLFDENQSDYYSSVDAYHSYCYMIPKSAEDPEKSAYIMDALAYYGKQMIKPVYYDICLQRKLTRDEESSTMLDIIFSNAVYDIGAYADFGGVYSAIVADVVSGKTVDIASMYEKYEGKIDQAVTDYVESLSD